MRAKRRPTSIERIERAILSVRGLRVMVDSDLAELYGVETRTLNQAVRRNSQRFPDDFVIELTAAERTSLRSQIVILEKGRGQHRKHPVRAFTEQGVAMLSSVLRSPEAIQVNVEIMRTFVRLRSMLQANVEVSRKLQELEKRYDAQFRVVFEAIRELMAPPRRSPRRIGYPTGRNR